MDRLNLGQGRLPVAHRPNRRALLSRRSSRLGVIRKDNNPNQSGQGRPIRRLATQVTSH